MWARQAPDIAAAAARAARPAGSLHAVQLTPKPPRGSCLCGSWTVGCGILPTRRLAPGLRTRWHLSMSTQALRPKFFFTGSMHGACFLLLELIPCHPPAAHSARQVTMTVQTTRDTGSEACDVVAQQATSVSQAWVAGWALYCTRGSAPAAAASRRRGAAAAAACSSAPQSNPQPATRCPAARSAAGR